MTMRCNYLVLTDLKLSSQEGYRYNDQGNLQM